MTKSVQKITLSSSRDIPFDRLRLSQSNVRRIKAGVSIEELAEDIARRGLLQGLSVRAVVDDAGADTGLYEIPAGGRRYRALELLVKQKRLARTAPVPCVVREGGVAEEDSLAENVQRAPLHPLDQFRAFQALREKGQPEEEIAAAFFVPVAVVKQRLKLASVSPKLLDVYAEDAMSLDQLMAFTVSSDHERQEQVFERLASSYDKQPYAIRRMLTEGAVRACDKRARFIGLEAYVEAGGSVMRDLFQGDDGGWLQNVGLVDRMVAAKLQAHADTVAAEGWKWVEAAPELPYGHLYGLRQLRGDAVPLTPEEEVRCAALQQEMDAIEASFADAEELSEEADRRMGELEAALEALTERPIAFDACEVARAGAFITIGAPGDVQVERGFVRPEDELPVEEPVAEAADDAHDGDAGAHADGEVRQPHVPQSEPEEDEGMKPLSDRLVAELTAHRTLALRQALGEQPDVAFLAALHALTLQLFYTYALDSCLELSLRSVGFSAQAPGLNDSTAAKALTERHAAWRAALPRDADQLWDALTAFDTDSRQALFAHCVGQSVNAVSESYNRRPRAIAHADRLAQAVDLDLAAAGWTPTVDGFLGRVTKARILDAVREARGERAAARIDHLKKGEMAEQAEGLLSGLSWLPELLRTPGRATPQAVEADAVPEAAPVDPVASGEAQGLVVADEEQAGITDPEAEPAHAIAAE